MEHKEFRLSEEDIDIIVDKVCTKIETRIYHDVGKGVLAMVARGVVIALIALAGYAIGGHVLK
jgi:hypothetical protein